MIGFNVTRLHYVAADGYTNHMKEAIDNMDTATFNLYLKYHYTICERLDMVGLTHHALDISRKVQVSGNMKCLKLKGLYCVNLKLMTLLLSTATQRRQGYATQMLALALTKCRDIGIVRVLVSCDKDNIASAKWRHKRLSLFVRLSRRKQ